MSVQTAEKFLQNYKNDSDHYADQDYSEGRLIRALQEFAKLHLKAQEEAILKNVKTKVINEWEVIVDKDSILNSYPLEKIQ